MHVPSQPTNSEEQLPGYSRMLSAYHRAYSVELRAMLETLPIVEGDRILDVGCGDGMYCFRLAELSGASGTIVGLDVSAAFLRAAASDRPTRQADTAPVLFCQADVELLPLDDDSLDVVWCAQSFYSLPSIEKALAEMIRVLRPGGVLGVLENDALHHILLPWPVELELVVRAAELKAFDAGSDRPTKFYLGRRLTRVLRRAGLEHVVEKAWASNRQAPLGEDDRVFLSEYLTSVRERVEPYLDEATRVELRRWSDPNDDHFALDRSDFSVTCIDHVVWAIKPGVTNSRGAKRDLKSNRMDCVRSDRGRDSAVSAARR